MSRRVATSSFVVATVTRLDFVAARHPLELVRRHFDVPTLPCHWSVVVRSFAIPLGAFCCVDAIVRRAYDSLLDELAFWMLAYRLLLRLHSRLRIRTNWQFRRIVSCPCLVLVRAVRLRRHQTRLHREGHHRPNDLPQGSSWGVDVVLSYCSWETLNVLQLLVPDLRTCWSSSFYSSSS